MQFTLLTITVLSALLTRGSAKSCNADECVSYYHGANCQNTGFISNFVPTCGGNCFQFDSFDSLLVEGNGILGTDCHAYSDANCESEIEDSGNIVSSRCVNTQGAKSMKCFYNC
ncbi:hypothetical protein MKEN_00728500 [Mycena kentingensis (nom. inval.)]|nr:hypothetical protein MKEN_00728500 [Mycena kentingensis (nom. inval.)]